MDEKEVSPEYKIINRTDRRIKLDGGEEHSLVIPAFGVRRVDKAYLDNIESFEKWKILELIETERLIVSESSNTGNRDIPLAFLGCGFYFIVFAGLVAGIGALIPSLRQNPSFWNSFRTTVSATLVILVFVPLVWWISTSWDKLKNFGEKLVNFVKPIFRAISQSLSLLLFLVIGLGLPAFIIYQFGDAHNLILPGSSDIALLGRALQFAFIGIASTLPALLYFLFDRQQLGKVRQNFYREVMRLDPDIQTLTEAETKYGELVEETYGSSQTIGFLLGTGSPILISTLLITMGWILTLLPLGEASYITDELALNALFNPARNALNFGFLGAYFFALNMVFRRYVRADLTPKAYTHVTMRLLITIVIVWVLSQIPFLSPTANSGSDNLVGWPLMVFAFLVGIVPETGLALLQDALRTRFSQFIFPSLQEEHPLTKLEGINLYDRARLLEEGIENIENLAHSQLIELMLRTRIPTPRLVDLFDQAILYLHIHGIKEGQARLREYGIRTATDLKQVYDSLEEPDQKNFLKVLDDKSSDSTTIGRLKTVLHALEDDEWMTHLQNWRKLSQANSRAYTFEDFAKDIGYKTVSNVSQPDVSPQLNSNLEAIDQA